MLFRSRPTSVEMVYWALEDVSKEQLEGMTVLNVDRRMTAAAFFHLIAALKENTTVKQVILTHFIRQIMEKNDPKLLLEIFKIVAGLLQDNKNIREIILDDVFIPTSAIPCLVEGLSKNMAITISMQNCRFEDPIKVFELLQGVERNKVLENINLFGSIDFLDDMVLTLLQSPCQRLGSRVLVDSMTSERLENLLGKNEDLVEYEGKSTEQKFHDLEKYWEIHSPKPRGEFKVILDEKVKKSPQLMRSQSSNYPKQFGMPASSASEPNRKPVTTSSGLRRTRSGE